MVQKKFGVKVFLEFAAAHHIRGYDGECSRPHGHNFKVEVEATTQAINSIGLAFDFKDFKKLVKTLVDRFDHQDLNTIEPFTKINPTAETLAQYFFEELESSIKQNPELKNITLQKVTIWENDRSAASFGIFLE
jgi:6-pyruvoyltetrahydropterin/6-carboxytetrahydropterin synthase